MLNPEGHLTLNILQTHLRTLGYSQRQANTLCQNAQQARILLNVELVLKEHQPLDVLKNVLDAFPGQLKPLLDSPHYHALPTRVKCELIKTLPTLITSDERLQSMKILLKSRGFAQNARSCPELQIALIRAIEMGIPASRFQNRVLADDKLIRLSQNTSNSETLKALKSVPLTPHRVRLIIEVLKQKQGRPVVFFNNLMEDVAFLSLLLKKASPTVTSRELHSLFPEEERFKGILRAACKETANYQQTATRTLALDDDDPMDKLVQIANTHINEAGQWEGGLSDAEKIEIRATLRTHAQTQEHSPAERFYQNCNTLLEGSREQSAAAANQARH